MLQICHSERAQRVEESTYLNYICSQIGAKILRLRFTPLRMTGYSADDNIPVRFGPGCFYTL